MATKDITTKRIPRESWIPFLNDFSRRHENWRVTIEILGEDIGDQEEVSELPLLGISADEKDNESAISMTVGHDRDQLVHIVNSVRDLWFAQLQPDREESIEIESADGMKTVVLFRK